ncbi:hypothetical protein J7J95_01690 [bacterium]|nr:hypothetical protein [bacterium]
MPEENNKDLFLKLQERYAQNKEKEELWRSLEALLTLVTIIFLLVFAIRPTVIAISELLSEINNKKKLSQRMKVKIDNIVTAQVRYAEIQEKAFLLDEFYPPSPQLAEGIAQVLGLVKERGLFLKQLSLGTFDFSPSLSSSRGKKTKDKNKKTLASVDFSLEVEGSYPQIKGFLGDIYQLRRGIKIDGYQIGSQEEKESFSLQLRGKFYFFGGKGQ